MTPSRTLRVAVATQSYDVTLDAAQRAVAITCIVVRRGKEHYRHLWQVGEPMSARATAVAALAEETACVANNA